MCDTSTNINKTFFKKKTFTIATKSNFKTYETVPLLIISHMPPKQLPFSNEEFTGKNIFMKTEKFWNFYLGSLIYLENLEAEMSRTFFTFPH